MATRIIILEQLGSAPTEQRYRYALWADVPVARRPFWAKTGAVSAWTGASDAQNTAIATGAIAEKVETVIVPGGQSLAQVRTALVDAFAAWQATVTAYDPWVRYSSTWDDQTGWTAAGV